VEKLTTTTNQPLLTDLLLIGNKKELYYLLKIKVNVVLVGLSEPSVVWKEDISLKLEHYNLSLNNKSPHVILNGPDVVEET